MKQIQNRLRGGYGIGTQSFVPVGSHIWILLQKKKDKNILLGII